MIDALVPVAGEVRRVTGELLERLAGGGSTNVVCSGLGVWCAAGLVAAGSDGETGAELASMLGVNPVEVPGALAAIDRRLDALGGATHALALWSRVPVHRAFRESVPTVGFGQLGDGTDLDEWTRQHTHGMIDRFPVTVTAATLLALADAIALWAKWETPFPADRTAMRPFRPRSGEPDEPREPVHVATMQRRSSAGAVSMVGTTTRYDLGCAFAVAVGDDAPVIRRSPIVRFGLGAPGTPPTTVMHDVLAEATGERVAADVVDVFLPRFAIECSHDLVEPLRSMGVRRVFTDGAELGRLSPEPLALDQARQVARVEVDEEGVKAAAVTALAMRAGAMVAPDPVVMELRFDRPFAFALLDPELDLPLFAGWLADPRS